MTMIGTCIINSTAHLLWILKHVQKQRLKKIQHLCYSTTEVSKLDGGLCTRRENQITLKIPKPEAVGRILVWPGVRSSRCPSWYPPRRPWVVPPCCCDHSVPSGPAPWLVRAGTRRGDSDRHSPRRSSVHSAALPGTSSWQAWLPVCLPDPLALTAGAMTSARDRAFGPQLRLP